MSKEYKREERRERERGGASEESCVGGGGVSAPLNFVWRGTRVGRFRWTLGL